MMNRTLNLFLFFSVFLYPLVSFAQDFDYITTAISGVGGVVRVLVPLLIGIAIAVFIWGVIRYMIHADNQEERIKGRSLMIYGIIALFVAVSIWGIIAILQQLTGTSGVDIDGVTLPGIPTGPAPTP